MLRVVVAGVRTRGLHAMRVHSGGAREAGASMVMAANLCD
jgi:hypothetical protein